MESSDFFATFDKIIRWATPLLLAIISLSIFIYKSKIKDIEQKIEEEREARKEAIKDIIESFRGYKEEQKSIAKELVQCVAEMEKKQGSQVSIMIDKIEDLNVCVNRTTEKIENYMYSQEKICAERHKWNGQERRSSRVT